MCPYCEFEDSKLDKLVSHLKVHTPENLYEVSLRMQKQMNLKTFRFSTFLDSKIRMQSF
jgi:hypothetical protein